MIQKLAAMGNRDWQLYHNNVPTYHHVSCSFLAKHEITQMTQTPYSPDVVPCVFWLFPKLKSPLKGKRFQTVDEIQENMAGQLMVIGSTVSGSKVPTLKGTKVSLSYVQYFLYLVFSVMNLCIFYSTWMDTFWTDLICSLRFWNLFLLYEDCFQCAYKVLKDSMRNYVYCSLK